MFWLDILTTGDFFFPFLFWLRHSDCGIQTFIPLRSLPDLLVTPRPPPIDSIIGPEDGDDELELEPEPEPEPDDIPSPVDDKPPALLSFREVVKNLRERGGGGEGES